MKKYRRYVLQPIITTHNSLQQPGFIKLENAQLPAFWFGIVIGRKKVLVGVGWYGIGMGGVLDGMGWVGWKMYVISFFLISLLCLSLYQTRKLEVVHFQL